MGLVALATTSLAHAPSAGGAAEKAIPALENDWLTAIKAQQPDADAPNFDDRFVNTDSSGKVTNEAQGLAEIKSTKFASAEYEDVKIAVSGDIAIVTGGFKGKVTDSTGKAFDDHERWTDTWLKTAGSTWICVASTVRRLPSTGAPITHCEGLPGGGPSRLSPCPEAPVQLSVPYGDRRAK